MHTMYINFYISITTSSSTWTVAVAGEGAAEAHRILGVGEGVGAAEVHRILGVREAEEVAEIHSILVAGEGAGVVDDVRRVLAAGEAAALDGIVLDENFVVVEAAVVEE